MAQVQVDICLTHMMTGSPCVCHVQCERVGQFLDSLEDVPQLILLPELRPLLPCHQLAAVIHAAVCPPMMTKVGFAE